MLNTGHFPKRKSCPDRPRQERLMLRSLKNAGWIAAFAALCEALRLDEMTKARILIGGNRLAVRL
jgi:hypothetical protein